MSNISTLKKTERNPNNNYSDKFFELFGFDKDNSFTRPNQIDFKHDCKRKEIEKHKQRSRH
jgi:hypothetical protein